MQIRTAQGRERLALAVKERRRQLKFRQEDVSQRGGPSKAILYQVENAVMENYHDNTIEALEVALRWKPGSVDDIIAGREPQDVPEDFRVQDPDVDDPETIKVQYRDMVITFTPSPGVSRERMRGQVFEALKAVMERLDEINPD